MFLILIVLAFLTHQRNYTYNDDPPTPAGMMGGVRLWEDVIQKSPNKARGHAILAELYNQRGRLNDALREWQAAYELTKTHPDKVADMQNIAAVCLSNMAGVYMDFGGPSLLAKADQLLAEARNNYPPDPLVLTNSVHLFIKTGEIERAIAIAEAGIHYFTQSSSPAPSVTVLYRNYGDALALVGRCDEQREAYLQATKIDPTQAFRDQPCRGNS